MRMTLRKDDGVARGQTRRWFIAKLDVTISLGDQVEDHHALGTRFK
jgi:hypothetical protein